MQKFDAEMPRCKRLFFCTTVLLGYLERCEHAACKFRRVCLVVECYRKSLIAMEQEMCHHSFNETLHSGIDNRHLNKQKAVVRARRKLVIIVDPDSFEGDRVLPPVGCTMRVDKLS